MFLFASTLLHSYLFKIMNLEKKKILNTQCRPTFEVSIIAFYKVRSMYLNVILLQCWIEQTVLLSHFHFT